MRVVTFRPHHSTPEGWKMECSAYRTVMAILVEIKD